jgi:murein DD-endopeptidase MepM/ murein hydrolase activator NlpD
MGLHRGFGSFFSRKRERQGRVKKRTAFCAVAFIACVVLAGFFLAGGSSLTAGANAMLAKSTVFPLSDKLDGDRDDSRKSGDVPLDYTVCVVQKGDTVSEIAAKYGVQEDSIISTNGIENSRAIHYGEELKIPNQDGLLYTVKSSDTVESIALKYSIQPDRILQVNHLKNGVLVPGLPIFLPGIRMDDMDLQRINGDLFIFPARGWISSPFGVRVDPITGATTNHHGIDLAVPWGTPVGASMAGTVYSTCRNDPDLGNYVVLSHQEGYKTYYLHLSSIQVREGQRVAQGQTIGRVGDTGVVTGTHLHFGVSQYGTYINPLSVLYHH